MNTWFVTVKDKDGVEQKFQQRGPVNESESRKAAERDIIYATTKRATDSGADDPGLEIVSIEKGPDDGNAPLGAWIPSGAKAVDLNKYANKDDSGQPINPLTNPKSAKK